MKNVFINFSLMILACFSTISCGTNSRQPDIIHVGSRDNIVNVTDQIVSIDNGLPEMHWLTHLILAGDTLLFHDPKSVELQFTAYDIFKNKVIGRFGKFGNGPGEIANLGAIFYVPDSKSIFGANANQGKIVGFYLPDAIGNPDYSSFDKFNMDFTSGNNAILYPHYLNDSTIICTVYVPDKITRSMATHIGNLNFSSQSVSVIDSIPQGESARFGITVSPQHNIIYAADKYQDVISIFNLEGKLQRRIYGPEYNEEIDRRNTSFSHVALCGDYVANIYSDRNDSNQNENIIVTDIQGNYIKTLKFDFPLNDIIYHQKTGRLYISTDGETQFGYIDFDKILGKKTKNNPGKQAEPDKTTPDSETPHPTESSDNISHKATPSDDGEIKCITCARKAKDTVKRLKGQSDSGPLSLVDLNTHSLTPVSHLKVGAYKESNGYYLYTIGLFNPDGNDTVTIKSISLPDGYFDAEWPGKSTLGPETAGFLRLWCKEPKTQENYSIVVTYDDNKYPDQAFSISLYPSGAQLYNEMHNN